MLSIIECEYDFCIYNANKKCIIKKIAINLEGCCDKIILPNIPKKDLEAYKTETILNLHNDFEKNKVKLV